MDFTKPYSVNLKAKGFDTLAAHALGTTDSEDQIFYSHTQNTLLPSLTLNRVSDL
jgi:hypothetical protein